MRRTREGTHVYFTAPYSGEMPTFERREYQVLSDFPGKPFRHQEEIDPVLLWNLLNDLYKKRCSLRAKSSLRDVRRPADQEKNSWAGIVNRKREFIATVIKQRPTASIAEICRITKSSHSTVKKVKEDLSFQDAPSVFQYNNLKPVYQLERLQQLTSTVQGTYATVSDIKRQLPGFSKRLIARKLRQTGLRWRQLVRRRKDPKEVRHPPRQVVELVSHLVQAMNSPSTTVLYVDEAHFPLVQTATHHWTAPEQCEDLVYNRRAVEEVKLSAIALCSLEGFVAVQIYNKDITIEDFHYFIQTAMLRVLPGQRVTVLADNASWHTSQVITQSKAGKFIYFNVKGLFQGNAIENAFSFIRAEFRKRPVVQSIEEEAKLLAEIFFHPENKRRFAGIHRNHLRSLMKLLLKHSSKLSNIKTIPDY